jgi:molybdopterin-guanine dinucleotide biosynthesis protein A
MNGVTGIVLAGGQGRRMGGVDKGLQLLHGKPMVASVLARLAPQVDEIVINANQNLQTYEGFGHRVVPDAIGGFAGPLAGLHAGLSAASHALVLTVPCDSPFLPLDLFSRLNGKLNDNDLAVAKDGRPAAPRVRARQEFGKAEPGAIPVAGREENRRLVRLAQGDRGAVRR